MADQPPESKTEKSDQRNIGGSGSKYRLSPAKKALLDAFLDKERPGRSSKRLAIPRRETGEAPLLSFAQQRLWFLYQLEGENATYNVPFALRLGGSLDIEALKASLNAVVARHEILRTCFRIVDGEPRQIISDELIIDIPIVDLCEFSRDEREERMKRLVKEAVLEPIDLSQVPLIRTRLYRMGKDEHVLFLNFHHAIIDEWSFDLLFQELDAYYDAEINGRPASLLELPIQYADYAVWQRSWLQGDLLEEQLMYWKAQFAGAPQALEISTDYPRPTVQSFKGATLSRDLPGKALEGLQIFAQKEGVTFFTAILTAFQVFLYRYTGQEDILIGTPIANRRSVELENLIGFFLNMLVIRSDIRGKPSFRELLRRTGKTVLDAFQHQDLPFERLVEEISPVRDLSRHPLFQVAFALHPGHGNPITFSGLETSQVRTGFGRSKFDLTCSVAYGKDQWRVGFEYSTDLFNATTIERMLAHFESLVNGIVADPDQPVINIPLLQDWERQRILVDWNATVRNYPQEMCVHQLFEAQVERTPEAVAVEFGEQRLTYMELNARSNQLAHFLQSLGVGIGTLVGICMQRSMEMIVCMVGILKAGGSYVPLDPTYPQERLKYMLLDTSVPVLLSHSSWRDKMPDWNLAHIVWMDEDWSEISNQSSKNVENRNRPLDLAYVMYTSGSTGEPKGIGIPHRAINRLVMNTDYVNVGEGDRIAQASNASFDAATFEVWGSLLNGASLVGLAQEVILSPQEYARHIKRDKINIIFTTTALFNQIAATRPEAFESVRDLMFGGEAVSPRWVREVLNVSGPQRLLHVYGPTESTTFATWYSVEGVESKAKTIPIGKAIANTQVYVLDGAMNPVPVGVQGELYIAGDGLARGYLNQPELTAEKFLPHPFAAHEGERLYRTGDLVRWLPEGTLEFLGRIDYQVKLRGFRIELGEIESTLVAHDSVAQAVVLMREDTPGDKRIVAYVVPAGQTDPDVAAVRAHLKLTLPDYMIPSLFVFLDELPLNPNGKVDRDKLPVPTKERLQKGEAFEPPRDQLEEQLKIIWESILGIEPLGIHDDFFEMGGHSLLAVQLFTQIEEQTGLRLPLATLFQSPTIAEIAEIIRQGEAPKVWSTLVPIHSVGTLPPFYFVHNFGGEVLKYEPLAQAMNKERPFFGLQARGLDGVQEPHTTIPEMAAYYVNAIREHQPSGPYFLGGYCFGGVVAYEMACQLESQGERVAMLAALDASAPKRSRAKKTSRRSSKVINFLRHLPSWLHNFFELGFVEMRAVVIRRLKIIQVQMKRKMGRKAELSPLDLIGDVAHVRKAPDYVRQLMEIHMTALMSYKPGTYSGHITLFNTPSTSLFSQANKSAGWDELARGGVTIREVPGSHYNIMKSPQVEMLAKELDTLLDRVLDQEL